MEKQNPYQAQLDDALRSIKESLIKQQETAQVALDSAKIAYESVKDDLNEAYRNSERTQNHVNLLSKVNSKSAETNLISANMLALATIASTNSTDMNAAIAKAAKSIEQAASSIAQLHSDAASIQAKSSTEDSKTELSRMADETLAKTKEAALSSEEATIKSLDATISAAQSNAGSVLAIIKVLSTEIDALNTAINKTYQTALTTASKVNAALSAAIVSEKKGEQDVTVAQLNFDNAKEANGADKTRIGLIAQEKEQKKQTTNTAKNA